MRNLKGSMMTLCAIGLAALATTAGAPAQQKGSASATVDKHITDCDRYGYIGLVSVYNTFSDAMSGQNPRYSGIVMPQRDGSIYMAKDMGGTKWVNFNAILTNWSDGPDPEHPGRDNPNNRNHGFLQLYDNAPSNTRNQKASWSSDLQTFTYEANDKHSNLPMVSAKFDLSRLWNAGAPQGAGESTKGTFWQYEIKFQATGLNGVDTGGGFIQNTNNATAYSGHFRAIFENTSERFPESNGFYVFNVTFNNVSWANSNGYAEDDTFGSNVVTSN